MDFDYEVSEKDTDEDARGGEIVRATDVLPAEIHLLPQGSRPFFPGQVMPLLVDSHWEETLLAVKEAKHNIIGLALVSTDSVDDAIAGDFFDMGTACRIHRVQKDEGKLQVLVEGLQRFRIEGWTSRQPPFRARVSYYPETEYKHVAEVKAYAVAIINTIKELVPLNPLYGEELKIFLEHFSPDDPSHLADFAASLTTAGKEELQEVQGGLSGVSQGPATPRAVCDHGVGRLGRPARGDARGPRLRTARSAGPGLPGHRPVIDAPARHVSR